jgi:SAM-dependent methyltransferase
MFRLIWKALEQSVVYRTFADVVGAEAFRRRLMQECIKAKAGDRVLDIGCGPADWLEVLHDVEYVGVDFNPEYIEAARLHYGDRGSFEVASVSDNLKEKYHDFDIVLAMGVLHHLTDEEADSLLSLAASALRPGGRFITLDGVLVEKQSPFERYLVLRDRGRFVRPKAEYEKLVSRYFGKVESRVHHGELRIPYTHLSMVCSLPKVD